MRIGGLALAIAFACSAALAQDGGITVWKNGMPPGGITEKKDFGDHLLEISHREVDGKAELHKVKADAGDGRRGDRPEGHRAERNPGVRDQGRRQA
jgi:hypothetical protein